MGQAAAIAGVTFAFRRLIELTFAAHGVEDRPLADVLVTTMPVDRARSLHHRCQLNITLATVQPLPTRAASPLGLRGGAPVDRPSPQPFELLYLLTAYGPEDDEVLAHRVMGVAMRALQETPVLGPVDLETIFPHTGASGSLEQIRVLQTALSREQIVAWWLAFHTPYRLTTAWQVTGVNV